MPNLKVVRTRERAVGSFETADRTTKPPAKIAIAVFGIFMLGCCLLQSACVVLLAFGHTATATAIVTNRDYGIAPGAWAGISYRFDTPKGQFTGQPAVGADLIDRLHRGDRIQVRYLVASPGVSTPVHLGFSFLNLLIDWFTALGVSLATIVVATGLHGLRKGMSFFGSVRHALTSVLHPRQASGAGNMPEKSKLMHMHMGLTATILVVLQILRLKS